MGFSAPFIARPVATILLSLGLLLSGVVAYHFLPISPLPRVDIPTIVVFAARPGADPETMANSIAAPLERRLGEIPGVTELTSISNIGATTVIVQFDIDRSIDGAAHDVQAAINAATSDLPSDLPARPYYRKINPADTPILTLALTSDTLSTAAVYDAVDTILAQRLAQADGVAQVVLNGSEKPAVRVQLDPARLTAAGLSAQDVYTTIRSANTLQPNGSFQGPDHAESIGLNGQISQAPEYGRLVLKSVNGAVIRLSDVATVVNGVANSRLAAWNGKLPAILLSISKTSDANAIATADRVRELLPQLLAWMPPDIKVTVLTDRTTTIRASVDDIQITLLIAVALVLLVVFLFLRRLMPMLAAAATVPLSLCGTVAGMWFCGYSLNNFSLMALTISVGFVIDDAIVMIENIIRHMEKGQTPLQAALTGSRQIGFTVLSISISLVAVFIPLLFMGGILGRLFHEFAMTLTMAIGISALVSLTLTPMICGRFMQAAPPPPGGAWGRIDRTIERALAAVQRWYAHSLDWALLHRWFMLLLTLASIVLTVRLYVLVPKGFLPLQDTGLIMGNTVASPDVSFKSMTERQRAVVDVLLTDPAIADVGSTIGVSQAWSSLNRGWVYISLKPLAERGVSAEQVIARLRPKLARVGGVQTFLYSAQDLRAGGRTGGAQYQFALISSNLPDLRTWTLKLEERLKQTQGIADVTSDQDRSSPQLDVVIDRDSAARLGVSVTGIDTALNNAYSQRQISTIYTDRNQYRVVLEIDPALQTDPVLLDRLYVGSSSGRQVPLSAVAHFERSTAPLTVRHQGQFPASTISFNLADGMALGDAVKAVEAATAELRMPPDIHAEFAGNAQFLQKSLSSQPLLIGAAFISIYIVLGVLYESLIQPVTIISTLPSAGLGALLALLITGTDLSIMGIIGIILLMGIVKKNAIMMVDFALEAQRVHGMPAEQAIREACVERFRPIVMTTLAALLGALPLALAFGTGAELRRPLGIAIVGGLIVSQMLTLYTTPVVYLAMERLSGARRQPIRRAPAE